MRKVYTALTGIFLMLVFTTCKQFTADIDEYLSYWSAEAYIKGHRIEAVHQADADGILCIPSAKGATVTFSVHNPKNFPLKMPASASDVNRIIRFPNLSPQPVYGTDYTLQQAAAGTLQLVYTRSFLQAHEWGTSSIAPEITLIAQDGRVFRTTFTMNLKVNTAPDIAYIAKGKTAAPDANGKQYYVLLFRVQNMDELIGTERLHKDIAAISVTAQGGQTQRFPLSIENGDFNTAGTDGTFISAAEVSPLDPSDLLPAGSWLLCLKTDVEVGKAKKEFTVTVIDEKGLHSPLVTVNTDMNMLPVVRLFNGGNEITGITESAPTFLSGSGGIHLTAQAKNGARIMGQMYKKESGNWTPVGSTIDGVTPVTIALPSLDSGETEALYKITLKAQVTGYADSEEKDLFVCLVRDELPILRIKQNFTAPDSSLHTISAGNKPYVTENIINDVIDAGLYKDNSDPNTYDPNKVLHMYNKNGTAKLTLTAPSGVTAMYKLDGGAETAGTEITVDTSQLHTVEVWCEKSGVHGMHITLYVRLSDNVLPSYTLLKEFIRNAPVTVSPIELKVNDLSYVAGNAEIEVSGGKNLNLRSANSSTATITGNGSNRLFNIMNSSTLMLTDIILQNGKTSDGNGGAVYVKAGGIFALTAASRIGPGVTKGDNDVYLETSALIKVASTLSATMTIARITPEAYSSGTQVLTGSAVHSKHDKFTVTSQNVGSNLWQDWEIKNDGTLTEKHLIIDPNNGATWGGKASGWEALKNEVEYGNKAVIIIDGQLKAPNKPNMCIRVSRAVTIKGKTPFTPNAPNDSNNRILNAENGTCIFDITANGDLTLKDLWLLKGKNTSDGGAIYCAGGKLTAENIAISECQAANGGGIYAKEVSLGGGRQAPSIITLTNTYIQDCKANSFGGGLYITQSELTMQGDKNDQKNAVKDCRVTSTGGCGGGAYLKNADSVNITNTSFTECKVTTGTASSGGGAIELAGGSGMTLTNCIIKSNEVSNGDGGGIGFGSGDYANEYKITGCEISSNTVKTTDFVVTRSGSGIAVANSSINITIDGCIIQENTIQGDSAKEPRGVGIWLGNRANCTIKNTVIKNNKMHETVNVANILNGTGGGIQFDGGTLTLTDGTQISGNSAKYGGGIHVKDGTFTMSRNATVTISSGGEANMPGRNDIFLQDSAMIHLDSELTPTGGKAARITVADDKYLFTTQVLHGAITENYTKFTVTPQPAQNWKVGNDGKLQHQ